MSERINGHCSTCHTPIDKIPDDVDAPAGLQDRYNYPGGSRDGRTYQVIRCATCHEVIRDTWQPGAAPSARAPIPSEPTIGATTKRAELEQRGMQEIGAILIDPASGRRATVDYFGRVEWDHRWQTSPTQPAAPDDLDKLLAECHAASVRNGWWSDLETGERIQRNKGECLCLVHSEISEGWDADQNGDIDDKLPDRLGAEVELADALIRVADYAGGFGYTLDIRPLSGHAFAHQGWDVLHSAVSAVMESERKNEEVAHVDLSALAARIIGYADDRGFDIWGAVREKLAFNAQRADHKPENRRQAGGKAF